MLDAWYRLFAHSDATAFPVLMTAEAARSEAGTGPEPMSAPRRRRTRARRTPRPELLSRTALAVFRLNGQFLSVADGAGAARPG